MNTMPFHIPLAGWCLDVRAPSSSTSSRLKPAVLLALLLSPLPAQNKDLSLESLGAAMEGRLGIYARNTSTGDEIAINADKEFPMSEGAADSRPQQFSTIGRAESQPVAGSPRKQALRIQSNPYRTMLGPALVTSADRLLLAGALSPTVEVGGFGGRVAKAPWIAGYTSTAQGDMVFAVMASDLASEYTTKLLFPTIVEACFRRLVPEFREKLPDPKVAGLVLASLHEKKQDPRLFPPFPNEGLAEIRRGAQQLRFPLGQIARLSVLGKPAQATTVTVQWWSPSERPDACWSQTLPAGKLSDLPFDVHLDKLGAWRVRVAFGDTIVLDEKFYVTGK
jgi:hypothetical protein